MPIRYPCLLFSLFALLVALWLSFPPVSRAAAQPDAAADSATYTVQTGDTLSGIAKKFGLSTAEILRANGLADRDRIAAGHVLHLPASAKAESVRPADAAAPQSVATAAVRPETAQAENDALPPAVPPDATSVPVQTVALPSATEAPQLNQQVVGTYKHPSLGAIQVAKAANGIVVTKDDKTIAMRHLLYATYDGTDNAGIVHSVHFVFDSRGDVHELQYSSSGTGLVTFIKAPK